LALFQPWVFHSREKPTVIKALTVATRLLEVDNANRFQQIACDEYFVVRRNTTKPVWFT